MATIEFVSNVSSNQSTDQFPSRWGRALHDAGNQFVDDRLTLQLWKQQHRQGVFSASAKFGFTGIVSRLQGQRRGHW